MPTKVPNARKAANDAAWEYAVASLLEFHRRHGHFQVPKDVEHPHLHYWTAHQRVRLSNGTMPPKRRKRLQAAGFPGDPHSVQRQAGGRIWDRHFAKLMDFRRVHGHFSVPREIGKPGSLWEWVNAQRRKHNSSRLRPDRQQCLEAFGFPWSVSKLKWETRFAELAARKKNFGHCHIPAGWPENPALARWMNILRHGRKNGTLSTEWIARLDQLGFDWEPPRTTGAYDAKWEARFAELAAYHQRFGHCRVLTDWPENPALARWVKLQCISRRTGRLNPERLARLEALDFDWEAQCATTGKNAKWEMRFAELAAYHQRSGNCLVPAHWPENPALAGWVRAQRSLGQQGKLTDERRARLDTLGFLWKLVGCSDETWKARFGELAAFQKRFGHCLVPKDWPDNPALAGWVHGERRRYSHTRQTQPERIDLLDAIHFVWAGGWRNLGRCWQKKRLAFMSGMVREIRQPGGV